MPQPPGEVAVNDVIAEWTERLRTSFPVELRSVAGEAPHIDMVSRPVGSIAVTWTTWGGLQSTRTAQHVNAYDPKLLILYLVVSGSPSVATAEHATRLSPGDLTVVSTSRPYQMTLSGRNEALTFSIPRGLFGTQASRLDAVTFRRCSDPVVHRIVAPALVRLGDATRSGDLGHADAEFGELVVSLARTVAAQRVGVRENDGTAGARGAVLLSQAKAYIEGRLHDADLRPSEVAAAQFISVRYLQKLFQAEGVTMLEWMRSVRLQRARRDLGDPSQGHRTIGEIAASWGFRHPGHFRRAFRAEFGVTPTEFRREALDSRGWTGECGASSGV